MTGVGRTFVILVMVLVLGAVIFLATWDAPPPQQRIEVTVPDDKLPR